MQQTELIWIETVEEK